MFMSAVPPSVPAVCLETRRPGEICVCALVVLVTDPYTDVSHDLTKAE